MAGGQPSRAGPGEAVTGSVNNADHSASSAADATRSAVGSPALAVDASPPAAAPHPSPVVRFTQSTRRRLVLRGLVASAAGVALAPVLAALGSSEEARFGETYRGRRIVGVRHDAGQQGDDVSGAWHVTVDGRPLHLMRRVDGSWMTMIDHYQSYPTPLAAARAAVDELGPTARLAVADGSGSRMHDSGTPSGGQGAQGGHRHVHA
ncbi:hypothetical protein QFZ22_006434 [Streptomyces canus]|uniref:Tyrosinase n=1 Tax=Streptomyces canus TaxID=58343 RepID=A0AAW8FKX5_9ACTN|nr:tyrosinase family oxidase copper chaperone [Streptomyces canus]MDQ0910449.1 hypothetical protein [Streptomyces canus]